MQSLRLSQANAADESIPGSSSLDRIKERGYLICGVNGNLPGFSFVNSDGDYVGIDVDLCRAIAAAILTIRLRLSFAI